jgi:ABC-type sulfate/molybdate transport systems ATPase subunit
VLKKVANAGASVLFTIHQPASEIFSTFDHLILLNKGRLMYAGPVTNVPAYFAMKDYPMPPNYNPADWIMVRCSFAAFVYIVVTVRVSHRVLFLAIVASNSMLRN